MFSVIFWGLMAGTGRFHILHATTKSEKTDLSIIQHNII